MYTTRNKFTKELAAGWFADQKIDVACKTLHGVGLDALKSFIHPNVVNKKKDIVVEHGWSHHPVYLQAILISLAKYVQNALCNVHDAGQLKLLVEQYFTFHRHVDNVSVEQLCELLPEFMTHLIQRVPDIDFDDMVWLPQPNNIEFLRQYHTDLPPTSSILDQFPKYDAIIVDDAEDVNEPLFELLLNSLSSDARVIMAGDELQSVYLSRDPEANTMRAMVAKLSERTKRIVQVFFRFQC